MKSRYAIMMMACAASQASEAQSNVTIYGVIDAGVSHFSSVAAGSKWKPSDGINIGNRLGFRGSEDLGGGLRAVFTLESALALYTGTGTFWQRQAYVGLSDARLGTLSVGRQYEFSWDFATALTIGSRVGAYAFHPGDHDRLAGTMRLNNSIKYVSPTISGFKFGALAAAAQDGSAGSLHARALGVSYSDGPLTAAVTWNAARNVPLAPAAQLGTLLGAGLPGVLVQDDVRNSLVAASYETGMFTHRAVFTRTAISAGGATAHIRSGEFSEIVQFTPALSASVGFTRTTLDPVKWDKFSAIVLYGLSKSTAVYASTTQVRASHGVKIVLLASPVSTGENQSIVRVGMRTFF